MRNSARRKGTPNSGSGEDEQLAHQKDTLIEGSTKHSHVSQNRWTK